MGLASIVLEPPETENWVEVLRANGFVVEVDENEMARLGPRPKYLEVPYIVRLGNQWLRVLFTSRPIDSKAVLVFFTTEKNCSPSLQAAISEVIKRTHTQRNRQD
jgi:hypothetical protein